MLKHSCLSLFLLLSLTCMATPFNNFLIKHIESDQLPQSTALQMLQDKYGYWWIVTHGGLARYDGHQIKTFAIAHGPGNHPQGLANTITILNICHNDSGDLIAFTPYRVAYLVTPSGLELIKKPSDEFWQASLNNRLTVLPASKSNNGNKVQNNLLVPGDGLYFGLLGYEEEHLFYPAKQSLPPSPLPAPIANSFTPVKGLSLFDLEGKLYKIGSDFSLSVYDQNKLVGTTHFTGDLLSDADRPKKFDINVSKILYAKHEP